MIEEALPADFEEMVSVFIPSLMTSSNFNAEEWEELIKTAREYSFPTYKSFVYRVDQKIVAFICLHNQKIEMLYVLPKYMRKGIATKLVQYIFNNFNPNEIGVDIDNHIAMHLYKKFGFKIHSKEDYDISGVYSPHYILKI